jgi:hypothetical protein
MKLAIAWWSTLPLAMLFGVPIETTNVTNNNNLPPQSWESDACLFFFGSERSRDEPALTNECFGIHRKQDNATARAAKEARISALRGRTITWPPARRSPASALALALDALKKSSGKNGDASGNGTVGHDHREAEEALPKPRCSDKKWEAREDASTLLINVARRIVYIKNWKAASSLVFQKLNSDSSLSSWARFDHRPGAAHSMKRQHESKKQQLWNDACRSSNSTTTATEGWVAPNDCMERAVHGTDEIASSEIGDAIFDNYFVFSFVRDPITRVESSFAQAPSGAGFEAVLSGAPGTRVFKDPHCKSAAIVASCVGLLLLLILLPSPPLSSCVNQSNKNVQIGTSCGC